MPRHVAFLITLLCGLSAAFLGFSFNTDPPLVGAIKPLVAVAPVHHSVDRRVVLHDHVHEHSVPDRAKQLREAAAAFKLAVRYAAAHTPPPFVVPSLWVCTMHHESDLRTGSHWTFRNGAFEGAFAMAHSTYSEFARRSFVTVTGADGKQQQVSVASLYPHAYDAPPSVQVEVAINARAVIGSSKWGGLRACGG